MRGGSGDKALARSRRKGFPVSGRRLLPRAAPARGSGYSSLFQTLLGGVAELGRGRDAVVCLIALADSRALITGRMLISPAALDAYPRRCYGLVAEQRRDGLYLPRHLLLLRQVLIEQSDNLLLRQKCGLHDQTAITGDLEMFGFQGRVQIEHLLRVGRRLLLRKGVMILFQPFDGAAG